MIVSTDQSLDLMISSLEWKNEKLYKARNDGDFLKCDFGARIRLHLIPENGKHSDGTDQILPVQYDHAVLHKHANSAIESGKSADLQQQYLTGYFPKAF